MNIKLNKMWLLADIYPIEASTKDANAPIEMNECRSK